MVARVKAKKITLGLAGLLHAVLLQAGDNGYARRDFTEHKEEERLIATQGQSRIVKVNAKGGLRDDRVSQPEIVYISTDISPDERENNEAPEGSPFECCYAIKLKDGGVLFITGTRGDVSTYQIQSYPTERAFFDDYYFDAHFVQRLAPGGSYYQKFEPVNYDKDFVFNYNLSSEDCIEEPVVPVSYPASCDVTIELKEDGSQWSTERVGTLGYNYTVQNLGTAAVCNKISGQVGSYSYAFQYQLNAINSNCSSKSHAVGSIFYHMFSASLNREGSFQDEPAGWGLNSLTRLIDDRVSLLPPYAPNEKERHYSIEEFSALYPNAELQKTKAVPASISGTWSQPLQGKSMQISALYLGSLVDLMRFCVKTNIIDGHDYIGLGFTANKKLFRGVNYVQVDAVNYVESCRAIDLIWEGQETGYILASSGAVFSLEKTPGGGLSLRMPNYMDHSRSIVYWVESGVMPSSGVPDEVVPEFVFTNLSAKP